MSSDVLGVLIIWAFCVAAIWRRNSTHVPAFYVFIEYAFTFYLIYDLWDYAGSDFGPSFYLWLAIKDTTTAFLLIILFPRLSIATVLVFYAIAALMNVRFYLNEIHYIGLDNQGKRDYYEMYLTIYKSYPIWINATMAGQILGLIIHETGGHIRAYRIISSRFRFNHY